MTFAIPAAPGTYLTPNEEDGRFPVVGWLVHPGGIASPVTITRIENLADFTVYHPDGSSEAFGDTPSAPPAPKAAPARASAPEKPKAAPKAARAASGGAVSLTGKVYAKKTFWQIEGEVDGVVLVEGGNPVPKGPGVAKITREDYFKLRKETPEIAYDDLAGYLVAGGEIGGAPEPELEPETGMDDEDDEDLI